MIIFYHEGVKLEEWNNCRYIPSQGDVVLLGEREYGVLGRMITKYEMRIIIK